MNLVTIEGGYLVPEDSHVGRWQQETQRLDHDEFIRERLSPILKPKMNVLDGGAFNGDHSIFYSEQVKPGIVVCVEAGELAYKALQHNAAIFSSGNVFTVKAALWSTDLFSVEHVAHENLGASCVVQSDIPSSLDVTTIDDLSKAFNVRFDFIKLDIEGCELHALIGGIGTIQAHRPIIMLEVNAGALKSKGKSFDSILCFLKEWDYSWEFLQSNVKAEDPQFDIICHPK